MLLGKPLDAVLGAAVAAVAALAAATVEPANEEACTCWQLADGARRPKCTELRCFEKTGEAAPASPAVLRNPCDEEDAAAGVAELG